jgi:hypothetical protein
MLTSEKCISIMHLQFDGLTQSSSGLELRACRGAEEGRAMFLMHNKEARECRLHAEHCEDKAQRQSDPQNRDDFLEMRTLVEFGAQLRVLGAT